MSNPVLLCENLSKTYAELAQPVEVLRGINLSVQAGQQLAIVGTSGSGKSTLLHLLGGLDKPTQGKVSLCGQELNSLSAAACGRLRNQHLGFIYQFHHLLPEFTALENVAMPLLLRKTSIAEAKERASSMLAKVGLEQRLLHRPAELSGGERQRAAIARALVARPACVLADEPTGNLDGANANKVYDLLLELNQELKLAFIIVTHDLQLASRTGTVWHLQDGKLIHADAS